MSLSCDSAVSAAGAERSDWNRFSVNWLRVAALLVELRRDVFLPSAGWWCSASCSRNSTCSSSTASVTGRWTPPSERYVALVSHLTDPQTNEMLGNIPTPRPSVCSGVGDVAQLHPAVEIHGGEEQPPGGAEPDGPRQVVGVVLSFRAPSAWRSYSCALTFQGGLRPGEPAGVHQALPGVSEPNPQDGPGQRQERADGVQGGQGVRSAQPRRNDPER